MSVGDLNTEEFITHLEVCHEGEERHGQNRDHDDQSDGQVHAAVRVPDDVVARPIDRLVHVATSHNPRQQADLHHQKIHEESYRAWNSPESPPLEATSGRRLER